MPNLLALLLPLVAAPGPEGVTSLLALLLRLVAAAEPAPPLPPTPELPSYGGLLLRTLLALLVVLVLAWVLLRWGLRRLQPGGATTGVLRVLARAPLDGRRAVILVEAAGRYLVLGVGEGSVSLLVELEPEAVDRALAASAAARPRTFAEVLKERLARKPPVGAGEERRAAQGAAGGTAPADESGTASDAGTEGDQGPRSGLGSNRGRGDD